MMRIFRLSMISDKCYIITNVYFYRVIDQNWTPEQTQGVSIHGCMQFLAGILESSKRALNPVVLRALIERLVNTHFPALLHYLTLELESLGDPIPCSFFKPETQFDYGFFKRSIEFYRVSIFGFRNRI